MSADERFDGRHALGRHHQMVDTSLDRQLPIKYTVDLMNKYFIQKCGSSQVRQVTSSTVQK